MATTLRAASGSSAENMFISLFEDVFGAEKTGYLYSQYPFYDTKKAYRNWRKDMPVLLISGQDDPVGDSGKGVQRAEAAMRKAVMKNVQMKLFPGARHDLLHEEAMGSAEEARRLIANWLGSIV